MKAAARRRRAVLRYRRRGYGPAHALLCRCPECVNYGPLGYLYQDSPFGVISNIEFTALECGCPPGDECEHGIPVIAPLTGFDLFVISKYTNPQGS